MDWKPFKRKKKKQEKKKKKTRSKEKRNYEKKMQVMIRTLVILKDVTVFNCPAVRGMGHQQ